MKILASATASRTSKHLFGENEKILHLKEVLSLFLSFLSSLFIFSSFSFFFFSPLPFVFSFLFLSGNTVGNVEWHNIPHPLTRRKDTCISKDASTQCYLVTLKWSIQLVLHLSAARQQQVARGNIVFLILNQLH